MKEKILAVFFTVFVLTVTAYTGLFFRGTVSFYTDAGEKAEMTLSYRKDNEDNLFFLKKEIKNNVARFRIDEKYVSYFKVVFPENVKIQKVVFSGLKKQKIELIENEYNGKPLKGIVTFDFVLVGFFSFFSSLFILNAFKNRHQSEEEEKLPRIMNIEFLRVLFTLGIVCCHFFGKINIYSGGGQGVEFFFILSGFFLSLTFNPERKTLEFAKSKFIRWIPLIIFGGFIRHPKFSSIFYPLFFLQNTGLAYQDIANDTAWYLGVLFWVLIFYLSVFKTMKPEARNLFIGTLVFFLYIICARAKGDARWGMVYSYFPRGLLLGIASVGLGCLLQQICVRKEKTVVKKSMTVFESIALLYVVSDIFVVPVAKEWIFRPIFHFILLYLFVRKEGAISNFFEKPVFAKMARYCLSIYLTHQYLTANIFGIYEKKLIIFPPYVTVAGILTASILLGIFAYHIIEKPATRALKKVLS